MEIKLIRKYYQAKYTIGRLYVNNRFFSDCLEPPSLHLTERSALGTILIAKYKGYRAIPTGRYRILITRSRRFGRWLPLLLNVKGFEGIRIHAGNKPEDTRGCILLGFNRRKGYVLDSTRSVLTIVKMITEAIAKGEKVFVEVR